MFSDLGLRASDLEKVALVWNNASKAVWGLDLYLVGQNFQLVNLEYFCEDISFVSSEKDLFDFLNL